MLKELEEFLRVREERIILGGVTIVVRELTTAAELAESAKGLDTIYAITVRCAFSEKGVPVFTDTDIPKLKSGPKMRLMPLFDAVSKVNGLSVDDEIKKSEAAPG